MSGLLSCAAACDGVRAGVRVPLAGVNEKRRSAVEAAAVGVLGCAAVPKMKLEAEGGSWLDGVIAAAAPKPGALSCARCDGGLDILSELPPAREGRASVS
eukprot:1581334-Pleurochrysis_carterae.AAC.1